ncbi:MAG: endolytic transglycosylase MltG [Microgenomates group bacterium]
MRVFKSFLFAFTLALIISGIWFYSQFSAPQKMIEKERFVVKLDVPEEQVIDELKEKEFIKNKAVFRFTLGLVCWQERTCSKTLVSPQGKVQSRIKPGAYLISKSMNAYELAKKLLEGPYQKWVIIPPGKRKEQVALILLKALGWQYSVARDFVNIAQEGYLYPDTYLIDIDADPQQVWQKLFSNFNEKFDAQLQRDLLAQNIRNDTAIKIASLIERESGGDEDKPIISAIIWNRLQKKMKLEIDATVQYAKVIQNSKFKVQNFGEIDEWWPRVAPGDLRAIESPYNTYLNKGLPPGPICSPSLTSIKAVAYPAQTDALYYLHSPDKQIHTARTYQEHEQNIKKYLQ